MVTEGIIIASITAVTTLIGNWLLSRKYQHQDDIKRAKREQFIDSKLESIEKKLDEHNHYAQRFNEIEKSIVRIDTTLVQVIKKG